jgi:two-component system response regulator
MHTASPVILLVEDNPRDERLAHRAFGRCRIANELVVVRDGVEALDDLFGTGSYAGRAGRDLPQVMHLDLQLTKVDTAEGTRAAHSRRD